MNVTTHTAVWRWCVFNGIQFLWICCLLHRWKKQKGCVPQWKTGKKKKDRKKRELREFQVEAKWGQLRKKKKKSRWICDKEYASVPAAYCLQGASWTFQLSCFSPHSLSLGLALFRHGSGSSRDVLFACSICHRWKTGVWFTYPPQSSLVTRVSRLKFVAQYCCWNFIHIGYLNGLRPGLPFRIITKSSVPKRCKNQGCGGWDDEQAHVRPKFTSCYYPDWLEGA